MVGDPCGGRAGRGQRSRWAGGWAGTQQAAAAPPRVSVAMRCREVQQATGSSAAGVWGVASTQRVGPLAGPQAGTPRVLHAEHVRPAGPCQLPLLRGAGRHAAGLVRRRHLLMVRRAPPPETGPTHPPTHPPTQCSRTPPPPPHTHTPLPPPPQVVVRCSQVGHCHHRCLHLARGARDFEGRGRVVPGLHNGGAAIVMRRRAWKC